MAEKSYLIIEMNEAKDGVGIASEGFYLEKHWTNKKLFKGSFEDCYVEKQKLLKNK